MNKKVAGSLIAQGVALSSRDHEGRTPIELAKELSFTTGNHEMVTFLEQAAKKKLAAIAFGKKDWEKYFGKVGKEPPLPLHILEILESSCSIWPNKKVADTHLLTLIPEKVNRRLLCLDYLRDLVKNPKGGGNKTDYYSYSVSVKREHGSKPSGPSYWTLMTKNILPRTRSRCSKDQLYEFNTVAARAPKIAGLGEYKLPKALEAVSSILMEYVRSGVMLYSDLIGSKKQYTYMFCDEPVDSDMWRVAIGSLNVRGLSVTHNSMGYEDFGLGGARKFLDF